MTVALDKKRFGPWALVTGVSSRIGKEFAQQIAASGINIVLVARRENLLSEVGVQSPILQEDRPYRRDLYAVAPIATRSVAHRYS
jgi:NADP-dependent 3-hydroxy acid dehydrogenase YdfG